MKSGRKHIYLAGFMGTGKSAVGAMLAERLERPFVDLDTEVVARHGKSIADIFQSEGEAAFREHETSALRDVVERDASVIALGGGVPTIADNARIVRDTGRTVLLTADWQSIWDRIKGSRDRPLLNPILGGSGVISDFDSFVTFAEPILRGRVEAYDELADLTIDTSALTIPAVVELIVRFLTENV